jgi:hypothetical protein
MMPVVFDCGACGKQEEWEEQLAKLKHYKEGHGDCNVPKQWAADPQLGRWVNYQRTLKRRLDRGDPCKGMTAARAAKLDSLGFAWELSAAALSRQMSRGQRNDAGWEGWLAKLEAYKVQHGNCDVPHGWIEDLRLANWVGSQRKYKKRLDRGEPCEGMTVGRAAKLDALGFVWQWDGTWKGWRLPPHRGSWNGDGWEAQLAKLKHYSCTRQSTATATCRTAGPRTRSSATGSAGSGSSRRRWPAASPARG